ncbi:MAG TPA: cupredoxin family protein [Burkholderiaceae bacterium]|nr:cupredoxin family protein [Burkholderiaceae bacterium]
MSLIKTALFATMLATTGFSIAHESGGHARHREVAKKAQQEWGIAGDSRTATRTIEVTMFDAMRFSPDHIDLKQGETVRFRVRNDGQVLHEFVIGTRTKNDEHAALMVRFPNMEHDEPYMAHVPPGQTGEIVWTFNRAGEFDFACLIAGHYQAGMIGKISVAAR